MAFSNSVASIHPGMGSPTVYQKRESVATNVGTVTITVPASGSFTPAGIRSGRIRVKTESIVSGGTVQLGVITATDGTTTVTVSGQQTALAANTLLDQTILFCIDIVATSITVTVIAGTQNSVHSVEVAGNP